MELIDLQMFKRNLQERILDEIKHLSYSELNSIINVMPMPNQENSIFFWNYSFSTEYFKKTALLEKSKTEDNEEKIRRIEYQLYLIYLINTNRSLKLSFKEFIYYSRLLLLVFGDKSDESQPHCFDVLQSLYELLFNTLTKKRNELLKNELIEYEVLKSVEDLTTLRINETKERIINFTKREN